MADKRTFERLYDAKPFNPDDRQDQIGEAARRALLDAATQLSGMTRTGQDMPHLLGGLLVGIVQVIQATAGSGKGMSPDEIDAAIRVSIMQQAAWAVDMSRAQQGKEPLPDA